MNCKPGDLAFIVKSHDSRNIGKLVTVLRVYPRQTDSWFIVCDSAMYGLFSDWPAGAEVATFDHCLRPIRDWPGVDETLQWAPVPAGCDLVAS